VLTLGNGQKVPWHHHSNVTDTFLCMDGPMQVETRNPETRTVLRPGERTAVPAGRPHEVSGVDGGPCRFLIVQGVGKYDFVPD
jgi:quercetin dioxygenase-like cupin family protein